MYMSEVLIIITISSKKNYNKKETILNVYVFHVTSFRPIRITTSSNISPALSFSSFVNQKD